ncbi:TniQ family protein [Streptomyces fungicidicus]|uniref:TniQ family protein n=1 Tax=Streptomyces fungicidicus TaxID=68203 RepID=UPI0036D1E09D
MPDATVRPAPSQETAPRRLPAVPVPGTRESLPSWISRIALAYGIHQSDVLQALGLSTRGEMRPTTAGLALSPCSVPAIHRATGIAAETISGMLLSRFAATALPNLPSPPYLRPGVLTAWAVGAWVLRRHSNFCPHCLARDGQWRLEWKLPWSFICLEHMVYLRNRCPRCQRVQSGLPWGWDGRVCRLRWPSLEVSPSDHIPHPHCDGATVCRGRLDQGVAIPVTDPLVLEGQKRLMRWLYGTAEESAAATEFVSLTALAAQRLTSTMLLRAQDELRSAHRPFQPRNAELAYAWTDPLHMAGAAHAAQRLAARLYRPERAVQWLLIKQPLNHLTERSRYLWGTSLVFGPFHHRTEHMRQALESKLVALPYQGPAYINTLCPYRVHPVAWTVNRPDPRGPQ